MSECSMLVVRSNVYVFWNLKLVLLFPLNYISLYTCSRKSDIRQYMILCFQVLGRSQYFKFLPADTLTNMKYFHRSSSEKVLTSSFTLHPNSHSVSYHMCSQELKVKSGFDWMVDIFQSILSIMIANMQWICNRVCADMVKFFFKTKVHPVTTSYEARINERGQEKFCGPVSTGNCVQRRK